MTCVLVKMTSSRSEFKELKTGFKEDTGKATLLFGKRNFAVDEYGCEAKGSTNVLRF